jgi:coproporphyrinogen III oxidase-like Fe-S oxidoreductase
LEEEFFLGLRLNQGIDMEAIRVRLGAELPIEIPEAVECSIEDGLLSWSGERLQLTARGRLLSNEVFGRLIDSSPKMFITR